MTRSPIRPVACAATNWPVPVCYRAMTALLLLAPGTPMLFQGQEFAASTPFLLFRRPRARVGRDGPRGARSSSSRSFPALPTPEMQSASARSGRPGDIRALQARFQPSGRRTPGSMPCTATCCGCVARIPRLRRRTGEETWTEPCSGHEAFVLRFFGERRRRPAAAGQLRRRPAPRSGPRAAAGPTGGRTSGEVLWSSEDPAYGGCGTPPPKPRTTGDSRDRRRS